MAHITVELTPPGTGFGCNFSVESAVPSPCVHATLMYPAHLQHDVSATYNAAVRACEQSGGWHPMLCALHSYLGAVAATSNAWALVHGLFQGSLIKTKSPDHARALVDAIVMWISKTKLSAGPQGNFAPQPAHTVQPAGAPQSVNASQVASSQPPANVTQPMSEPRPAVLPMSGAPVAVAHMPWPVAAGSPPQPQPQFVAPRADLRPISRPPTAEPLRNQEVQDAIRYVLQKAHQHGSHPFRGTDVEKQHNYVRSMYGWRKPLSAQQLDEICAELRRELN